MRGTVIKRILSLVLMTSLCLCAAVPSGGSAYAKTNISKLHVDGTKLCNEDGKAVQLKGVSLHGLPYNWDTGSTDYINKKSFKSIKSLMKANTIRIPVYTDTPYGDKGYCNVGNDQKKVYRKWISKAVKYATEAGMYVIIDWHILDDNDPDTHKKEAKKFFKTMAKKYADYDNVIYEICNEPHWVSWKSIRKYAKTIVSTIREYDDDAIIIVGTNTWSQDVDEVIGSKLDDDNTMYALHFYAATHKDDLMNKAKKAIKAGVPVFISECDICDASGGGNIDKTSGKKWMKLIKKYKLPYVVWSWSKKNETASLLKSSCTKKSGWKKSDLSTIGKWWYTQMRKG